MCNVLSVRGSGYNCTVYFYTNRQVTDNMYIVGRDPHMRKGCCVHVRSKVGVGDDAVLASTGLPPDRKVGGLEVWSVWSSAVVCGLSGLFGQTMPIQSAGVSGSGNRIIPRWRPN